MNSLERTVEILGHNRVLFRRYLTHFSIDQLNTIPAGFNNNIFWNIAHCLVTLQRLVYHYSGLPMGIPEKWMQQYNKGTAPQNPVTDADVQELLVLFDSTYLQLCEDLKKGKFKDYQVYTTSTKMKLKNVEDALTFSLFHEGIHVGSVLALAKKV